MKNTILRIWIKTIIVPALASACYFLLAREACHSTDWANPGSHVFGTLVFFVSCVGYPIWYSYNVRIIQQNKVKQLVLIQLILLALFIYFSDYPWAHESGYLIQYHDSITLFIVIAKRVFEIVLGLSIFLAFNRLLKSRKRKESIKSTLYWSLPLNLFGFTDKSTETIN
jgi:NADH:ubiquinone oxidoreductase subunit K